MKNKTEKDFKTSIANSKLDIYSAIEVGDQNLWIPTKKLEIMLSQELIGVDLSKLALRSRSKVVKQKICTALGYPTPTSFKKTKPRFPGQQLDVYTQKRRNLQVWNEELSPARRYALIIVSDQDIIIRVKVVNGQELSLLDTTNKITTKYQAAISVREEICELVSPLDTDELTPYLNSSYNIPKTVSPTQDPQPYELLPIRTIFERLSSLIGTKFKDPGITKERNRGENLHKLVCKKLGYYIYEDKGQFPDLRHQLLEVKLQTSPTIDLGLVLPSSQDNIDVQQLLDYHPKHKDTRYAIFHAYTDGDNVTINNIFLVTGADFFTRFRQFKGKTSNGKLQMILPRDLFEA